jgi:hypothetical protein
MQYVPELTWILFLRILDERETHEAEAAEAVGADFTASLEAPYRWQDWAAPDSKLREEMLTKGKVLGFVNDELLPYLKGLRYRPSSTHSQKVISEILSVVKRSHLASISSSVRSSSSWSVSLLSKSAKRCTTPAVGPAGSLPSRSASWPARIMSASNHPISWNS